MDREINLDLTIEELQKPCLLGTARVIPKVVNMNWEKKNLKKWSFTT